MTAMTDGLTRGYSSFTQMAHLVVTLAIIFITWEFLWLRNDTYNIEASVPLSILCTPTRVMKAPPFSP